MTSLTSSITWRVQQERVYIVSSLQTNAQRSLTLRLAVATIHFRIKIHVLWLSTSVRYYVNVVQRLISTGFTENNISVTHELKIVGEIVAINNS